MRWHELLCTFHMHVAPDLEEAVDNLSVGEIYHNTLL